MNSLKTCVLIFCGITGPSLAKDPDPCTTYRYIGETDTTHEVFYRKQDLSQKPDCQSEALAEAWYRPRFNTHTDLSTSCPDRIKCGTLHPIWMTSKIPEIPEEIVNRSVCRRSGDNCCSREWSIQVKNCGLYRVYRLLPTDFCSAAYCFVPNAEPKSNLTDYIIIGIGGGVIFISATAFLMTIIFRRQHIRQLRRKWAHKRGKQRSVSVIGRMESRDQQVNLSFDSEIKGEIRKFSETPRAWENVATVETKT